MKILKMLNDLDINLTKVISEILTEGKLLKSENIVGKKGAYINENHSSCF